jgi:hypothetical protein
MRESLPAELGITKSLLFHGGNRGSIPYGTPNAINKLLRAPVSGED